MVLFFPFLGLSLCKPPQKSQLVVMDPACTDSLSFPCIYLFDYFTYNTFTAPCGPNLGSILQPNALNLSLKPHVLTVQIGWRYRNVYRRQYWYAWCGSQLMIHQNESSTNEAQQDSSRAKVLWAELIPNVKWTKPCCLFCIQLIPRTKEMVGCPVWKLALLHTCISDFNKLENIVNVREEEVEDSSQYQ